MARQVEILLADVCPSTENPDDCVARLPDFWMQVGAVLWPGYYDPTAEWMCATDDICVRPSSRRGLVLRTSHASSAWMGSRAPLTRCSLRSLSPALWRRCPATSSADSPRMPRSAPM